MSLAASPGNTGGVGAMDDNLLVGSSLCEFPLKNQTTRVVIKNKNGRKYTVPVYNWNLGVPILYNAKRGLIY